MFEPTVGADLMVPRLRACSKRLFDPTVRGRPSSGRRGFEVQLGQFCKYGNFEHARKLSLSGPLERSCDYGDSQSAR